MFKSLLSVGLGCQIKYAKDFVYTDSLNLNDKSTEVLIGVNCRTCDRIVTARLATRNYWSGRRELNPRPKRWQRFALPLSYSRKLSLSHERTNTIKGY